MGLVAWKETFIFFPKMGGSCYRFQGWRNMICESLYINKQVFLWILESTCKIMSSKQLTRNQPLNPIGIFDHARNTNFGCKETNMPL